MKVPTYQELLAMSENQLRKLATNLIMRRRIQQVLYAKSQMTHNGKTYKEMMKHPNKSRRHRH